jgi:hypothetical protein
MYKVIFISLFIVSTVYNVFSQSLTGRVTDENGKPLSAATVIQPASRDSAMINAVITDSSGIFRLPAGNEANSIPEISFFGYDDCFPDYSRDSLRVQPDMKNVSLTPKTFLLNEVVVKGNSPGLSRKAGLFSFSLANTALVKGNNTWEILKFTPFLKADDISGVEMTGKGQVTVYINGRRSCFTGTSLKGYIQECNTTCAQCASHTQECNATCALCASHTQE